MSPLFPVGFGLGYTSFAHGPITASATTLRGPDAVLELSVPVTNTGPRSGTEVVQLYLRDPVAEISRPTRELRGFCRLTLAPGETAQAHFTLRVADLEYERGPDIEHMRRGWEGGDFIVMIGSNALETQDITIRWEA